MQTNAKIQYIIIMPENDNQTTGLKWVQLNTTISTKILYKPFKHWLDD